MTSPGGAESGPRYPIWLMLALATSGISGRAFGYLCSLGLALSQTLAVLRRQRRLLGAMKHEYKYLPSGHVVFAVIEVYIVPDALTGARSPSSRPYRGNCLSRLETSSLPRGYHTPIAHRRLAQDLSHIIHTSLSLWPLSKPRPHVPNVAQLPGKSTRSPYRWSDLHGPTTCLFNSVIRTNYYLCCANSFVWTCQ